MSARKPAPRGADLDDLLECILSLCATHGTSEVVDALFVHATSISQAADDERVQIQWAHAADKLQDALRAIRLAEETES